MKNGNKHYKELFNFINKLTYSRDVWEVFSDFLEVSAISINNRVDIVNKQEREVQYLKTIGKYSREHQNLFPELFALLVLTLEYELEVGGPTDILGFLFYELELHNKYKGQFFTPQYVCDMMGKMSFNKNDKIALEKGFITVSEPCCGSGAMILGFAKAVKECGYNYCKELVVTATDIDLKCVYMCYIQLALYGIPAVVIHGNSITNENWSCWYTPIYVLDGWFSRA